MALRGESEQRERSNRSDPALQGGARGGTLGGRIALRMAGRLHPAVLERIANPEYPWRKARKDAPADRSEQLSLPGVPRGHTHFSPKLSARSPRGESGVGRAR